MQHHSKKNRQGSEQEPTKQFLACWQPAVGQIGKEGKNDHSQNLITEYGVVDTLKLEDGHIIAADGNKGQGRDQESKIDSAAVHHNGDGVDE